ncbi:MAG TPA: hypothetical protein VH157_06945 [Bryobacteraceae bacterium]|jgi:hypothetical protein|nr:hypothetical protein [Bryobacteraceae bacterium]
MISGTAVCSSFKLELFQGLHNFSTDTFFMALYQASAPLSPDSTTAYITDGEIVGPGYTAGGQALKNVQILGPVIRTAYATFDDPVWKSSSLTARGALIYNQSKQQRAVLIFDFVTDKTSVSGNFWVRFPPPGPTTALIRYQ